MKKAKMSLAEKIKTARKAAGLSQRDFGRALVLTDKAVSSYEVGRSEPTIFTLKQMAKVTNRPVSYFVEDFNDDEIDMQIKLQNIERDLAAIKKILQRKYRDNL